MMEAQQSPFTQVKTRTLLSLFQSIPGYEQFVFKNVSLNELRQIVYEITLQQKNRSKRLIKTKKDISILCSQIGQTNLQINQVNPIDTNELITYLNQIYFNFQNDAVKKGIIDKFKGQITITLQNGTQMTVNGIYYGSLTQTNLTNYADIKYWPFGSKQPRFLLITESSAYLLKQQQSKLKQSLIIDSNFSYSFPYLSQKDPNLKVSLQFSQKQIELMAPDIKSFIILAYFIKETNKNKPSPNIYSSFAPIKNDSKIKYYIDGKDYFQDLYNELKEAKKSIYITGWRISPAFLLTRNPNESSEFQTILKTLAKEKQVKIYILLYNVPSEKISPSKPDYVYKRLSEKNIHILLHPRNKQQFWSKGLTIASSHHEKLVVIDKEIAFMGGFDIAFGRYDDNTHRISDIEKPYTWPGADYCNERIIDNPNPDRHDKQIKQVKRAEKPRMPWHDIGARLQGSCMKHLQAHFTQYWNHAASSFTNIRLPFQQNQMAQIQSFNQQEEDFQSMAESTKIYEQAREYFKQQANNKQFLDQIKQQIIKILKGLKQMQINSRCVRLSDIEPIQETSTKEQTTFEKFQTENAQIQSAFIQENQPVVQKQGISTQILRSSCNWSLGLKEQEIQHSIMNAYKELIRKAQRYIYIENQFFMSKENGISMCIVEKIIECHRQKKPFKVIVMLPAVPGLAGNPNDSANLFIMIRLTLDTINNMYNQLKKQKMQEKDIENYLYFFSLRTHDKIGNKLVTEIIYIHSKLMIVDDRYVIIGSANINNRSMLGDRDSQLAVLIQDTRQEKEFAIGLLDKLIKQHFDIDLNEERLTEAVWREMITISQNNHSIYKKIFNCYPDNQIKTLSQLQKLKQQVNYVYYEQYVSQKDNKIRGNAIPYQRLFLEEQTEMGGLSYPRYWFLMQVKDRIFT